MTRFAIVGIAVLIALTVFALVDAILIDRFRVRGVPKGVWVVLILILPGIGALLWFLVGRGRKGSGGNGRRSVAPDDDPDFLRGLNFPPPGDNNG